MLRFEEKGGKFREIPVRHDLQRMIAAYIGDSQTRSDPIAATLERRLWNCT
jgi:hypothetical protein